jgi:hypothetical protein
MPEPLFENFWNGLTAEDRQEFIKQAKGKLTGLKAKLATGQDGFAKMLVLQEYWLKEEAASLVVDNSVENEVYNF